MSDITIFLRNPWEAISKSPPHILEEDLGVLRQSGITLEKLGWRTEQFPCPFLGNYQKASVIFLCLNPGFCEPQDIYDYNDKYYHQESIKTLTMSSDTPFFCLDSKVSFSGAYLWWTKILKQLINQFGREQLSNKLMCLQYLAYHSITYVNPPCILPSQNFTFDILRQAMKDKKTIVIMRSKKLWVKSVPELETYPYIELKNYRRPFLSERNMGKENFEKLIESLRK
jgi:hypothetical protein